MTKLFVYQWHDEYSEDYFFVAADSLGEAEKVVDAYLDSYDFWGNSKKRKSEIEKFKSRYKPREISGIYVDDSRKNHKFFSILDGAETDFIAGTN